MYDHVAAFARGFEPRGHGAFFRQQVLRQSRSRRGPPVSGAQDVAEFEFVRSNTDAREGTPDRRVHDGRLVVRRALLYEGALGASAERRQEATRQFVADVATSVISPNVLGLVELEPTGSRSTSRRQRPEAGRGRPRRRGVQPRHARRGRDEEHAHLLLRLPGPLAGGARARRLPRAAARVRKP